MWRDRFAGNCPGTSWTSGPEGGGARAAGPPCSTGRDTPRWRRHARRHPSRPRRPGVWHAAAGRGQYAGRHKIGLQQALQGRAPRREGHQVADRQLVIGLRQLPVGESSDRNHLRGRRGVHDPVAVVEGHELRILSRLANTPRLRGMCPDMKHPASPGRHDPFRRLPHPITDQDGRADLFLPGSSPSDIGARFAAFCRKGIQGEDGGRLWVEPLVRKLPQRTPGQLIR